MTTNKNRLKKRIVEIVDEEVPDTPASTSATGTEPSSLGGLVSFSVQSLESAVSLAFSMIIASENDVVFASNHRFLRHLNASVYQVINRVPSVWTHRFGYSGEEKGFAAQKFGGTRKSITEVAFADLRIESINDDLCKRFDFSECRKGTKVVIICMGDRFVHRVKEARERGLDVVTIHVDHRSIGSSEPVYRDVTVDVQRLLQIASELDASFCNASTAHVSQPMPMMQHPGGLDFRWDFGKN